ncbi:MAG TPA: hypothetical protein VKE22_17900 [Haliangiales bacterium]|nr:hypothetical protein [Haliangiales bacterium]
MNVDADGDVAGDGDGDARGRATRVAEVPITPLGEDRCDVDPAVPLRVEHVAVAVAVNGRDHDHDHDHVNA